MTSDEVYIQWCPVPVRPWRVFSKNSGRLVIARKTVGECFSWLSRNGYESQENQEPQR